MRYKYIGRWGGVEEDHLLILNLSGENGDKDVYDTEREKVIKDFSLFSNIQFALERKISVVVHYVKLMLFLMCFVYYVHFFL